MSIAIILLAISVYLEDTMMIINFIARHKRKRKSSDTVDDDKTQRKQKKMQKEIYNFLTYTGDKQNDLLD